MGCAAGLLLAGVLWTGMVAASADPGAGLGLLPSFDLMTFEGERFDLEVMSGRVVVVNFWASWCPPCRAEAPVLARVASEMDSEGVLFLGVLHRDRVELGRQFAEQYGLTFPNVVDDGSLASVLGVRAIPTTFVVDASGEVVARHFGPIREGRLRVLIEDALARAVMDASAGGGE